ncbi:uncharacterized protein I303_106588 [Kwoniella dejecticola CBS 10117]|uniref:Dystroglycan-type cadherin-like domain-containing protein n=1 Tax=Kwoniella dejecticola CBS 10117 TaxID=1296121 RepID=A0A1A5ZUA8_9TREE|nr:uncharacterized protein I303_08155 [Kwoniella dejecticola CBS 10117]OBR81385.1 hypothetical protein I303_08155 [Kwoniella dejecticola CBS 10117]
MIFSTILAFLCLLPALILASSIGSLTILHSLNQQHPPVGRVDQPFQWSFSENTFSPASSLSYTAFNLPPWLSFVGTTRTFSGNPTSDDIGTRLVQITATTTDGQSSISDHVAFVVSELGGNITLGHSIADQLNLPNSASITSAYPFKSSSSPNYPGVRVPPNWSFSLGFTPSTFKAPTKVFYSASLKDGSPLPAWLAFNNQTVTFDGVTPADSDDQTFEILLSGSDMFGYSDIQQSFTIVVSAHSLQLTKPLVVNMTLGYSGEIGLKSLLRNSIGVDDKAADISDLSSVNIDTSSLSWLEYDSMNMSIIGSAPPSQQPTDLPVCVTDNNGDTLNTTLKVVFYPSLFKTDKVDPIILESNKPATISLGQYLSNSTDRQSNLTASFDPKEAGNWLSLSNDQKSLSGTPPSDAAYDSIAVTLRAQDLTTNAFSKSMMTLSLFSNTTAAVTHHPHAHSSGLSKGTTAAIAVVCSLVGILLVIFLLMQWRRRTASNGASRGMNGYGTKSPTMEEEGKWSYEAAETPALEYVEKMGGDPATTHMLVLGRIDGGSSGTVVGSNGQTTVLPHLRMGSGAGVGGGTSTINTNGSRLKRSFLSNPFSKTNKRVIPKISNPIIMPSLGNAAFQAQLAAAVDKAGIVKRDTVYTTGDDQSESGRSAGEFIATPSYVTGSQIDRSQSSSKLSQRSDMTGNSSSYLDRATIVTDDSKFAKTSIGGQSSRASWESEPPFVWTTGDTPAPGETSFRSSARSSSSGITTTNESHILNAVDPNAPTQRADFKVTNIPIHPSSSSSSSARRGGKGIRPRAGSPGGSMNSEDEEISIDNIHFPTDSDLAHTETSSLSGDDPNNGVIIQTASRIDARRTLDSPATASLASSHTERAPSAAGSVNSQHTGAVPSPVMTTHSRLVSFGKQKKVEVEHPNPNKRGSISHSAVVEAGSIGLGIGMGTPKFTPAMTIDRERVYTPSPPPESPLPLPPTKAVTRPKVAGGVTGTVKGTRSPSPPSSLPSLPALPTSSSIASKSSVGSKKSNASASSSKLRSTSVSNSANSLNTKTAKGRSPLSSPQRILLGVSEPFHFYPPLSITPSNSNASSNASSGVSSRGRDEEAEYLAFVEKRLTSTKKNGSIIIKLTELPDWLHFEDGELWGVPRQQDRGEVDIRIVERRADDERVVGRFSLEVVGR